MISFGLFRPAPLLALAFLIVPPTLIPECPDDPSDADGDGFTVEEGDCDDTDAAVYPEAPEVCDGKDNDCEGTVDDDFDVAPLWYLDGDSDGWGRDDQPTTACAAP